MDRRNFVLLATAATLQVGVSQVALARSPSNSLTALERLPQMLTLQVMRGEEVVVSEERYSGALDRPANIKSCSKSIVALLLGIAIERGEILSVDATLGEVAPALIPIDATPGVTDITMGDLVSLRAGLQSTSGSNYGAWVSSGNWVADALRRPMQDTPGGRMIYSTGSTHILGAALAEATGKTLLMQARERIGHVIGISIPRWIGDPQGYYFGGNEMSLSPKSMLSIATMMRDGGKHDGRQVIPLDWVLDSIKPRTRSPYSGMGYGYGWFVTNSGYVLARGYGGQVIAAHLGRNLAVAITSDPTQPARSAGYFGDIMELLEGPVLSLGKPA